MTDTTENTAQTMEIAELETQRLPLSEVTRHSRNPNEILRICDTCVHAAQHPFRPASKVICLEGYGVRRKTAIACRMFAGFPTGEVAL